MVLKNRLKQTYDGCKYCNISDFKLLHFFLSTLTESLGLTILFFHGYDTKYQIRESREDVTKDEFSLMNLYFFALRPLPEFE